MNHKNIFGELEYELGNFFVPHRKGCTGQYSILKRGPWYVTDAYILIEGGWCEQLMPFDSWIQAVAFLKKNVEKLI